MGVRSTSGRPSALGRTTVSGRPERAVVVYHSVYGQTRAIAEAIAEGLGDDVAVDLVRAHGKLRLDLHGLDLLVVGGPTHNGGLSDRLALFLEHVPERFPAGLGLATFDTRYRRPRLFTGSAATQLRKRLAGRGATTVAPAESFFVESGPSARGGRRRHDGERLAQGELERARVWAAGLRCPSPPLHRRSASSGATAARQRQSEARQLG